MHAGSISPEEFRKLQMKIDILQRFLTKTFGSTFLDFCKETKLTLTNGSSSSTAAVPAKKPLPALNKQQMNGSSPSISSVSARNVKTEPVAVTGNARNNKLSPSGSGSSVGRRPPPLLHRPGAGSSGPTLTISSVTGGGVTRTSSNKVVKAEKQMEAQMVEYYEDGNEEDVVQFLQPETVFSDDDQQQQPQNSAVHGRNSMKRDHSAAFGYDDDADNSAMGNGDNMHLPEGTECIMIESDEDHHQGQHENYTYQQEDEELYENADVNNEYYDEDGYGYSMVDEGVEDVTGNDSGNYTSEELHTDGNVVFGNVITATDTGIQYFQCSFCPSAKVFKHKQSLKEHYLLNHSPTPPAFQCQCGRRFLKQSQLKRHEVVHTAERPFVCPICLKDFTRKDNMTVHMVRNHAEKKHACPHCPDKVYATLAEVNRHLRMYHSQWQQ